MRDGGADAVVSTIDALCDACCRDGKYRRRAVQLVSPYNADLQQKASTMQAEVGAWDLGMRTAAGTLAADPRYPDVVAKLDGWRGEADAMLTLAVSSDPGVVKCSAALKAVHEAIVNALPPDVRAAVPANDSHQGFATWVRIRRGVDPW